MALLALLLAACLYGQDWPQWRGPARTGISASFTAPAVWPKQLQKVWSAPVGGGYSSPVVSGNSIYLFTRDGAQEVVQAVDAATGKTRWTKSYAAVFEKNKYATAMSKGPFSTPAFHQDKLITYGVTGMLSCWNASTGALLWRQDFSKRTDTTNLFTGAAASPLIDGGTLYIPVGDDRGGEMLALDAATGNRKWAWNGDGPSYSSAIIGRNQLIAMTTRNVAGLDPRTGSLLWKVDAKDEWNENIVTPVLYGNLAIFSGVRRGSFALDLSTTPPKPAWENKEITMYMSSPVLDGDFLYGLSNKRRGNLFCLDARSGKLLWSTTGREGINASLVSAGNYLFVLNETGDLKILRRNPAKYEEAAAYKVSEAATWAQPVILKDSIIIKDESSLTLYRLK